MERFKETPVTTDVYARVKLLATNEIQRQMAVNTMRDAETVVNGFVWLINAVKGLFGSGSMKPSLKG